MVRRRRYALAGASGRALNMFVLPLMRELADVAEIVGVFDASSHRSHLVRSKSGADFPVFDSFEAMIEESRPDAVIVTTVDATHHRYVVDTLRAGLDVVVEKPLTTDEEKLAAILKAEAQSEGSILVTFNYRFIPYNTRVKRMIAEGAVGRPLHVDFELTLDTVHGASYFRRWHRRKANSGTLLVHKATHYFDLFNWWLDDQPVEVFANGSLHYYGPNRPRMGERCLTCEHAGTCELVWDIREDAFASEFYQEAEAKDGYVRDRCVFGDDIDIYDTMSVMMRYRRGASLTFSLNAHSPYEGWKMSVHGTGGKLEAEEFRTGPGAAGADETIRLYARDGLSTEVRIPKQPGIYGRGPGIGEYTRGGHKGGDRLLRAALFRGLEPDDLGLMADSRAGALSALCGIAACRSIEQGRNVRLADLAPGSGF